MNIKNMNTKNTKKATVSATIFAAGVVALIFGFVTATASVQAKTITRIASTTHMASTTRVGSIARVSSTTRQSTLENRQNQAISIIDSKSMQEITSRIASLNTLSTRLNSMKNLSAAELSTLSGEITTLTGELTGLKAKIQADASSTAIGTSGALASSSPLRQDVASITKAYRVYALVIPQTQILAAADRVSTLVTSLTTLSTKLQSRLSAAQANGTTIGVGTSSLASLQAVLTDLTTKAASAQTQAILAVNAVSNLVPDNGNTTIAASNTAALKTGRTDIETAQKDIAAADKDAHTIVNAVTSMRVGTGAGTSTAMSATTTVSPQ